MKTAPVAIRLFGIALNAIPYIDSEIAGAPVLRNDCNLRRTLLSEVANSSATSRTEVKSGKAIRE
jgi:hypothetical protein